jgi:hypothetical protein
VRLQSDALTRRQTDRLLLVAVAIGAVMFVGFAKNYYLRAWLGTRPIGVMVHVHGAVMTAWVALFLTQTLLVSARRVDLHRKLGIAGAVLAAIVVALGLYTIAASAARQHLRDSSAQFAVTFVAFDGVSLLLFGALISAALLARLNSPTHKRLMLMAIISLLPPALGRLVAYFTHHNIQLTVLLLMYASVLLCVGFDTARHHRLYPALGLSGALVIAVNQLTYFAQVAA